MIDSFILLGASGILGILGYFVKDKISSQDEKISMLQHRLEDKTTEAQVRQVLSDKLEPVIEDLHDIKQRLEKITDYLLKD